jgi:hypothetical protein
MRAFFIKLLIKISCYNTAYKFLKSKNSDLFRETKCTLPQFYI